MKGEFGLGGRSNYIQKILTFAILNKRYFAVARSAGLVQLYEKMARPGAKMAWCYKLVKEWKNSTIGPRDPVVALGAFRNQYMYTCSSEGKLVIRDLINDDADDSVKLYVIDGPVSCLEIRSVPQSMRILVAAGGKKNSLKLYDLDLSTLADFISNLERIYFADYARLESFSLGLVSTPPFHRLLARSPFQIRSSFVDVQRLPPVSDSSATDSTGVLKNCMCWVLSVCVYGDTASKQVYVGTQFGDVMAFEANEPFEFDLLPSSSLRLSQFAIHALHVFNRGRFLLYADAMSKIGVLDTRTMKVVNFYDHLRIGPTLASRVYTTPDHLVKLPTNSKVSKFKPIYVVATTIDGALVIYKLMDGNDNRLCLHLRQAGVVPNFDILDPDPYAALEEAFADDLQETPSTSKSHPPEKRHKPNLSPSSDTDFLMHHSNDVTTPHELNESLTDNIKTMKLK